MKNYGYVKVAAASPMVQVGNCEYNSQQILEMTKEACAKKVSMLVFPELSITAYTCGDLFNQQLLIEKAEEYLIWLCQETRDLPIISVVGLPMNISGRLYNVAAVYSKGKIHGIVPKTFLPNYGEFYEKRWFVGARELKEKTVKIGGQTVEVSANAIFEADGYKFAVEICEDIWTVIPPSSIHALYGADVILNLSASNETIGKHQYRKDLIAQQSARCFAAYIYASVSAGESTTDLVYSGCNIIAENGRILSESQRYTFENQLTMADVDISKIRQERQRNKSFTTTEYKMFDELEYVRIPVSLDENKAQKENYILDRYIEKYPFIPRDPQALDDACKEVFSIQAHGLIRRMMHINIKNAVIGVSGGLDSTLALLVLVHAYDKMGINRKHIWGITMPGFGTSDRTYRNALQLMQALGITIKEIPIKNAVIQHFKDIEHNIENKDVTYENAQARERTQILMDYANKVNGLVIGTGDLSELALGWCTYNGDHMSMYAINSSVAKTLVRALVRWFADNVIKGEAQKVLHDIVDTPVSPELLPSDTKGEIGQITEDVVGPYILHDFFLHYMLRFGFAPSKIYFMAQHAFKGDFGSEEILKWMKVFYRKFFTQQFKRSCLPDGPKIGSVSLSPRGDWKMPSDASFTLWMDELNSL